MTNMEREDYDLLAHVLEQAARSLRQLGAGRVEQRPDASPTGTALLTVSEVAEELRVSRSTVYGLIAGGGLPSIKVGSSRRVARSAMLEWIGKRAEESL